VSDLQDLIHTNAHNAYEIGVRTERERIIKLLDSWGETAGCFCCASDVAAAEIIDLVEGKVNE
jgi:hypothetical protein